jgi:uncharacterized protein YuzE
MDLITRHDAEADGLVVKLRESALADEELLDSDVIIGYDHEGNIASIEILDASKRA